ncbi:MAG TPA: hypothetical protein VFG52_00295 [Xanthomonadales bacterium]|nr:hypothetical protein [Xanthomonadales bacterium]
MKALFLCCFLLLSTTALQASTDPVTDCRKSYADNPTAHIACLEAALQDRPDTQQPGSTAAEASTVLGSEQVIQKKRASGEITEQPVAVQIVAIQYNSAGQGVFKLDNGQIWRETEVTPRHMRLDPGDPYQATLERGTIGGYRMQVEGVRRMLKVERLK